MLFECLLQSVSQSVKNGFDNHSLKRRSFRWGHGWTTWSFGPLGCNNAMRKVDRHPSKSGTQAVDPKTRYAAEQMQLIACHSLKDILWAHRMSYKCMRRKSQQQERLDDAGLRRMLRFVSGSDVVCVNKVKVLFTPIDGLAWWPIAHTCGAVLELPWDYTSYPHWAGKYTDQLKLLHVHYSWDQVHLSYIKLMDPWRVLFRSIFS